MFWKVLRSNAVNKVAKILDLPVELRATEVSTSIISDCIEAVGHRAMAMEPGLWTFHKNPLRTFIGPAHTCTVRRTEKWVEIDKLLEMVDATPANSIVVVAPDHDIRGALWGGLMSTRVKSRGGVAAIVDGGVRDLAQINELHFPVFAAYTSPLDIRGRAEVVTHSAPVTCRGVDIEPGDTIVADANGVVVVPREIEASVTSALLTRLDAEKLTEKALLEGESATEVYKRHQAF